MLSNVALGSALLPGPSAPRWPEARGGLQPPVGALPVLPGRKEQMLELLVLGQFLAILLQAAPSWEWGHDMMTCTMLVALAKGFWVG